MVPSAVPLKCSEIARARSEAGVQRAAIEWIAGKLTASPTPSAARMNSSRTKDAVAIGVRKVAIDHSATPAPSTRLPPKRSANNPPGNWNHR